MELFYAYNNRNTITTADNKYGVGVGCKEKCHHLNRMMAFINL